MRVSVCFTSFVVVVLANRFMESNSVPLCVCVRQSASAYLYYDTFSLFRVPPSFCVFISCWVLLFVSVKGYGDHRTTVPVDLPDHDYSDAFFELLRIFALYARTD